MTYLIPSIRGPRRSSSILDKPTYKSITLVSGMDYSRTSPSRKRPYVATNESAIKARDLGLRVLHRARVVAVIREQ